MEKCENCEMENKKIWSMLKLTVYCTDEFSGAYSLATNVPNVFLNNKFLFWRF